MTAVSEATILFRVALVWRKRLVLFNIFSGFLAAGTITPSQSGAGETSGFRRRVMVIMVDVQGADAKGNLSH